MPLLYRPHRKPLLIISFGLQTSTFPHFPPHTKASQSALMHPGWEVLSTKTNKTGPDMGLLRNQSHWFKWGDPVSVFFLSPSHNIENTEPHFSFLRHHGAKTASHKKRPHRFAYQSQMAGTALREHWGSYERFMSTGAQGEMRRMIIANRTY